MPTDSESWKGASQRAKLSGFSKLRAILWPRSIRLVEVLSLGAKKWYWRLRWTLMREFSGLDLHARERLADSSDIFGETPILTVLKLLDLCKQLAPSCPSSFVDLGSGRGTTCMTAANVGFQSLGLEKEEVWVERASRVAKKLSLSADFTAADFLEATWPESAVFFTVGTAYSEEVRSAIAKRWASLSPENLIIVGDWDLGARFEELWYGRLPVDWGIIEFRIYRPVTGVLSSNE